MITGFGIAADSRLCTYCRQPFHNRDWGRVARKPPATTQKAMLLNELEIEPFPL